MTPSLTVERVVPAEPVRVWDAWTTAAGLAAWWWRHIPGTVVSVDARVGGHYRITNPTAGIGVCGTYLALDAPRRLSATWIWIDVDDDGRDVEGPREEIDVVLDPHPDGTALTIVHRGPWTTPGPAADYLVGWNDTLPALDTFLAAGP